MQTYVDMETPARTNPLAGPSTLAAALRALGLAGLVLGGAGFVGCAEPPPEAGDDALAGDYDPEVDADPEEIDPEFFRGEGLFSLKSGVRTVNELSRSGACSTAPAAPLTRQIAAELACLRPGVFTRIDGTPNVTLGAGANPYLQPSAAAAMATAARTRSLTVNSTWRSVAQQYLLKSWEGRCGIRLAASPGRSNHESGLAIDVDNYSSQAVRGALSSAQLSWYCSETNGGRLSGCNDPVHFTSRRGQDLRAQGVMAFQKLWNRNNPQDRISEDGSWGPQTAARMARAPIAGFANVARCDGGLEGNAGNDGDPGENAAPGGGAVSPPPPANTCGDVTAPGRCEGDTVARCVDGRVVRTDCASLGRLCGADESGALCVRPDDSAVQPPPADPCAGMPPEGRCEGAVAEWCDGGQLRRHDCSVSNQACGYVDRTLGYYCIASGAAPGGNGSGSDPAPGGGNGGGGEANPPAPPAVQDPGYQADGECTPLALPNYSVPDTGGPAGESISRCVTRLSNADSNRVDCRYPDGQGPWYITTFGGGADSQATSCGGRRADGTWYYAANAHRFGCGARFKLWNDRGCVVVETADVGAHVCVEEAAGGPIWDLSPLATRILTGYSQAGWSEHLEVFSQPVAANTPLGACD
ncbi:M15 family metallopeptidase [Myxococcota bacterium]|nr:M15 family metallopeptidase [Myxococcota bacterium]